MPAKRHSISVISAHEADLEPDVCRIKVVVRVRPFNNRGKKVQSNQHKTDSLQELQKDDGKVVQFKGNNQVEISSPAGASARRRDSFRREQSGGDSRTFTFDQTFWSFDKPLPGSKNTQYASQKSVFDGAVTPLLDHAFAGFNTCIFAYGQTGSGKSYTMLGFKSDPGIIPRIGEAIFNRIQTTTSTELSYNVTVAYYEIYNEKVRDLLNLRNKDNLKVREHPLRGPYVEDLSVLAINSYDELYSLLAEGNKTRTVAATNMNQSSSRSHAVFTITLSQTKFEEGSPTTEKVSRIHLVDLAGSERVRTAGTSGARLKEGAEINRSLTTLGRVISTLVEKASHPSRRIAVPYRESTLTWLLKDALGGNSMTAMIATIAPSASNYEQTLSTLRFADNVKQIKNHAIVNEDPNAKLIRELKEELNMLRSQLNTQQNIEPSVLERQELMEKLSVSEKLLQEVNQTWEQKISETEQIQKQTANALEDLGISIEEGFVGLHTPRKVPFLVNLSEDPVLTECLVYNLRSGTTLVGHMNNSSAEIRLSGSRILFEHCSFINLAGSVTISPCTGASVIVNGDAISEPQELHTGFRIILGHSHIFRYTNPLEKKITAQTPSKTSLGLLERNLTPPPLPLSSPSSSINSSEPDWTFALNEAAAKHMGLDGTSFDALDDNDLENLYSQVLKVKNARASRPGSALGFRDDSPQHNEFSTPRRSRLSIGDGSIFLDAADFSPRSKRPRASSNASVFSTNSSPRRRSLAPPIDLFSPPSPMFSVPSLVFSERERLAKKYADMWREHTLVKEINTLLSFFPLIRKAQRYSDLFDLNLKFQLMVADNLYLSPYERSASVIYDGNSPICVRVMNFDRDIVHLVSPHHLWAHLPQTEQFENLKKPQLPLPFTTSHYTLFGCASGLTSDIGISTADIVSPYTHAAVGVAKLIVREVTTAPLSALKKSAIAVTTTVASLEIRGASTEEVIDLHASLFADDSSEPILVTPVLHLDSDGVVIFPSYFHVDVQETKSFMIIVYGSVRRPFLDRLLSWDEMQEPGLDSLFPKPETPIVLFQNPQTPEAQESENFSFVESLASRKSSDIYNARECVGMYLRIKELNEHGVYSSVDVVNETTNSLPSYSFLHQGLQRRIEVTLLTGDDVFRSWNGTPEMRVKIGNVRMVDAQGMVVTEGLDVERAFGDSIFVVLKQVSTVAKVTNAGFTGYTVTCQWPSTNPQLDRITRDSNRLLFEVSASIGKGIDKVTFKCPASVSVRPRLSVGVSRWEVLFGQVSISDSDVHWFLTRKGYHRVPKTGRDFEALMGGSRSSDAYGHISQRGVSLLSEYYQIKESERARAEMQLAKQKNMDGIVVEESTEEEQQELLRECIDLWKKKTPTKLDIVSLPCAISFASLTI